MTRRALLLALVCALPLPAAAQRSASDSAFSHRQHAKLFPTCEGCHGGVASGDLARLWPREADCQQCHNGTDERAVTWRAPVRAAGLLRFSHPEHATETDSVGRQCATCHAVQAGAPWMHVGRATPESCASCHAHRTPAHLAEGNRCTTCHVPLTAATGIPVARVAALPEPPSHADDAFLSQHGRLATGATASCAVCHARESCASCHVNASRVASIQSLGRDPRVARLVAGRAPVYPVPADHRADAFPWEHGDAATRDVARCGACHARPSCQSCHTGLGARRVIAELPAPEPGGAQGVQLRHAPSRTLPPLVHDAAREAAAPAVMPRQEPHVVRVHAERFRERHEAAAAAGMLTCSGCHEQRFCSDCHAGETSRRFHPANFTMRHAADAYGRETSCASCHNTETFCRDCHAQSGLASRGRLDVAFHSAQPQWLLQHGRAARQGMESCTSCHVQRDCMTCHATTGWGVNPHGRTFDANRLGRRAGVSCQYCHLTPPVRSP